MTPTNVVDQVFGQLLHTYGPYLALLAVLMVLIAFFNLFLRAKVKGWLGEKLLGVLLARLDPATYKLLADVMLPADGATTQIDHIVVSRFGIFVIEQKTYKGWIFGKEHEQQWTQNLYGRKFRFQNPLHQNFKHIQTLSGLLALPASAYKSVIAFSGEATFKTPMPSNVIRMGNVATYIRGHTAELIPADQVPGIVATIRQWAASVDAKTKANHIANLRQRHGRKA